MGLRATEGPVSCLSRCDVGYRLATCRSGSRRTTVKLAYSAGCTCRWLGHKLGTAYMYTG